MSLKEILSVLSIVFILSPVIFVSGCVEGGGMQSVFESLGIVETETVKAPTDVIVVEDIEVIPNPPVSASTETTDSTFTISFIVTNIGLTDEGAKAAEDVYATVYDWGRCDEVDISNDIGGATIYPGGGAELVEWQFKAPTNEDLGRMEGKCPIRFKVEYEYDSYTTSDIAVIDHDRLINANRAGEKISITPVQTQSRGPLKIEMLFETQQPVDENLVIPAIIRIHDEGSGMYEEVPSGVFSVEFDNGLTVNSCHPVNWINVVSDTEIVNDAPIPLIKGVSPPIRCDLQSADISDIKTYKAVAKLEDYVYPLYEERMVTIKPTYTMD